MVDFQYNDPSLESQWRAIILFGKNSATYKFAFAKALLEVVKQEQTSVTLQELAKPFAMSIVEHLKQIDKQGNSKSSRFLNFCRDFRDGNLTEDELIWQTEKLGFVNVVNAFQNVRNDTILNKFYEVDSANKKNLSIKDSFLNILESNQFKNLENEVEARWRLVETSWDMNIKTRILEVNHDPENSLLFMDGKHLTRRINITSVRDALNGYQKGKCFFSFQDISIVQNDPNVCHVDHFFPHVNILDHYKSGANLNGIWNLVLAQKSINSSKLHRLPDEKYLVRLFNRNEFYIESKHPLGETIKLQTGFTRQKRISFLREQYQIALNNSSGYRWKPDIELIGTF